jgi:hypothetical protein
MAGGCPGSISVSWENLTCTPLKVEDTYDLRRKIPETKELLVKYDGIRT